jgi:hypothetical protein
MKHVNTFESFLNEANKSLTVKLTKTAADSMERDLKANGVEFTKESPTVFVMDDSPKARTAIRLVKERFGTRAIIVENRNIFESALNESSQIFVSDPKITDEASLKASIDKNISAAFNKLLKDNGINFPTVTVKENRGRYEMESKPLTGKDLGIMQYGIKELYINSFGGGSLPQINKAAEGFEFTPFIWFNLHYSYKHGSVDTMSQGSNGCNLYLPGERSSDIFYDVVKGVFLKRSEAEKQGAY